MHTKTINLSLVLVSLLGYLEWGKGQHVFLGKAEFDILTKIFTDPKSVLHPFTVLPLVGQLLLLSTLFQRTVSARRTYWGLACLGLLIVFMFLIGCMSKNVLVILSTLPFISL